MKIDLSGHHVELTEALHNAVNSSIDKLVSHYPNIETVKVILTVEKHQQSAEAVVHFLGQDIVAKASGDNLYHSIVEMKHKLETLLKRRKAIIKSHPHQKLIPEEI